MPDSDAGDNPVLIVEDDREVRDILRRLLELQGLTVQLADSGQAALSMLRNGDPVPALILMDLNMPMMTGAELLRRIRGEAFGQPVIIASGLEEEEVREQLQGQSVEHILHKPYSLKDLIATVGRYLPIAPPSAD